MSYRIEISPNNRATCTATHCKKEGIKITKGDLRQGVLVQFQEHQTWKYRHWGCVTPEVLHNWMEKAENDMELIDGYDTLPPDAQDKVKRALEQSHVDDEDWNGDIECNRYTGKKSQGMFVKASKKKAAKDEGEDTEAGTAPAKKAPKKRGRAEHDDANENGEEKPASKKAKGKKAIAEDEDDKPESAPPAKKQSKSRKTKQADEGTGELDPKPTARSGRKARATAQVDDNESAEQEQPAPTKKAKSRKGVAKAVDIGDKDDAEPEAPKTNKRARKARGKKEVTEEAE